MNEKELKKLINTYFKNKYYEKEILNNNSYFKNLNFDRDFFESYSQTELTSLEKNIIKEHIENKKSLKKIAIDFNYSYSYTRRVYLEAIEKLKIIARLHIFTKNTSD